MKLLVDEIDSPVGTVMIAVRGEALCALEFCDSRERLRALLGARYESPILERSPNPRGLSARIRAYFAGDLTAIDSIPVETGGTPFQQSVWTALRRVPVGTTATYGQIAAAIGRPTAARAVGITNGLNPVALVVPCHRIIGADGALTGYGGGLDRKRWLLQHEGVPFPAADGPPVTTRRTRIAMTPVAPRLFA